MIRRSALHRRAASSTLLLVSLGLTGLACSSEIDADKLEESIRDEAEDAFDGYDIGEVTCPEGIELKEGDTFECEVEIEDTSVDIEVTQEDDEGNVTIEQTAAVLDVATLVDTIGQGIAEQTGVEVTVDCGDDAIRVEDPGDDFECTVDATDGSESATVTVTVVDTDGNVEWALG